MTVSVRQVLLVEDEPDDVFMMREALKTAKAPLDLQVVGDGEEAMAYLRGEGRFGGAARPALVLLDWRLPKKNGAEVLREIREDLGLKLLPVLVLTTSASDADVEAAYALGANAFLTKPAGLDALEALVSSISEFWLVHAVLPSGAEPLLSRRPGGKAP